MHGLQYLDMPNLMHKNEWKLVIVTTSSWPKLLKPIELNKLNLLEYLIVDFKKSVMTLNKSISKQQAR